MKKVLYVTVIYTTSMHMKVTCTLLTCAMIPQCIDSKSKAMFPANINVHCCSYLFPHVQAERMKYHRLEILNTLDNQIHISMVWSSYWVFSMSTSCALTTSTSCASLACLSLVVDTSNCNSRL